jgi:uracil-DNA glycosylase family 4
MDDDRDAVDLRALVGGFRVHLGLLGRSGLLGVARAPGVRPPRAGAGAGADAGGGTAPAAVASGAPRADASVAAGRSRAGAEPPTHAPQRLPPSAGLLDVRAELGDCQRCKLCTGRKNLVFGVGNPAADLVFVGEGPGADEDEQGEPFVGKAGQLLNKMIEAMGYRREDVYICNVVKCRPPGNRNPEPDEIAACEPFLKKQLAAIRPRMIVTLGKFAAQCLLRDDTPISRLRGQFRTYEGVPLMPTFHPAYLLRDPTKKKEAWEDLKAVMHELDRLGRGVLT